MTASPDPLFLAACGRCAPRRARLGWSDVVRVLHDDSERSFVLDRLRASSFDADSFARFPAARALETR
jgi:hypothetical protein